MLLSTEGFFEGPVVEVEDEWENSGIKI
jgi:hypothetical protein